ncbi:hypothetical protein [Actinoplanes sp. N902-109]|uniref:hypothetical protein n=1 Tax=Actinoplanes sp. (strain N902-109) TaxID=649831 RepID=UPI000329374B|nr:hypothetical protein [Actinoplanes sp. N902-109]AGL20630.1 integral membrane protein [Actinoplanes sp. N902-109]
MTELLLSLHVLAAIIAVGPVTVAASMFPGVLRRLEPADVPGSPVLRILHRICRVYAGLGLLVPLFGLATAGSLGVLTDAWLLTSIVLTAVAGALLGLAILPGQARALSGTAPRLGMLTGVFNLLWATVVVLMIVRPGSTTGA